MGSVPSIRVEGTGLNATVDLLLKVPQLKRRDLQEQTHVFLVLFTCCSISQNLKNCITQKTSLKYQL